ncbi:MAG: hypothetical protein A2X66_03075 [Ignavibacteria bacterium GWA2_54_16]|nr:MAG: hypothetical protein A2X66_03075 [Ignavibacteria bacterium GWA2_54_16]
MRVLNLLIVMLLVFSMTAISQKAKNGVVVNGIYAVLQEGKTPEEARKGKASPAVLVYDGRYTDSSQVENPSFVAVDTSFFVPLVIEGKPDVQKDGRGHALLGVALKQEYKGVLEKFSQAHLCGRIAIVLDGEVITMHKVRMVITGGKFQLTRCYDNACEALQSKLLEK